MEISNYNQALEAKDAIYRKMDTCYRVGVIKSFNYDLSVDAHQIEVRASVNKYEFATPSYEWKMCANIEGAQEPDVFNEADYNALSEYLDNLLIEKLAQVKNEAAVLNSYYGK